MNPILNDFTELAIGLQIFGVTEYESKVYLALLGNGPSTVNQLQYLANVPRTKVYPVALQLAKKGLIKEIEGRPLRFQANSPEVFRTSILDGEKRVRAQKRVLGSLKKITEKNILPHDIIEEKYLSFGSQSTLMKLKEMILKTQNNVRCIVDGWGSHLIQECAEEFETISSQDIDIMILSAVPGTPIELEFSSSRMKVRYGRHLVGKSVFMFDNMEIMIVNSQTGRGYTLLLNELRDIIADEVFKDLWSRSTSKKTVGVVSAASEDLLPLLDASSVNRLFVEAVAKALTEEKLRGIVGSAFLSLLEERIAPKFSRESFENAVKLIAALMEEDVGEGARTEFDPLTRILRIEIPDADGTVPNSVWSFALAGLLAKTGTSSEVLQNTTFTDAKTRVILAKILPQR